jgi:hypothetical protein
MGEGGIDQNISPAVTEMVCIWPAYPSGEEGGILGVQIISICLRVRGA